MVEPLGIKLGPKLREVLLDGQGGFPVGSRFGQLRPESQALFSDPLTEVGRLIEKGGALGIEPVESLVIKIVRGRGLIAHARSAPLPASAPAGAGVGVSTDAQYRENGQDSCRPSDL